MLMNVIAHGRNPSATERWIQLLGDCPQDKQLRRVSPALHVDAVLTDGQVMQIRVPGAKFRKWRVNNRQQVTAPANRTAVQLSLGVIAARNAIIHRSREIHQCSSTIDAAGFLDLALSLRVFSTSLRSPRGSSLTVRTAAEPEPPTGT